MFENITFADETNMIQVIMIDKIVQASQCMIVLTLGVDFFLLFSVVIPYFIKIKLISPTIDVC